MGRSLEVVHQGSAGFAYLPADHDLGFITRLARGLARDAKIPMVVVSEGREGAVAYVGDRGFRLPERAADVLGADHPHLRSVAADLVSLACHPGAGDLVLVGWRAGDPLSLQDERGTHGGPGPAETAAFVLLPPEAQRLVGAIAELRPRHLREVALQVLGRAAPRAAIVQAPAIAASAEASVAIPLRIMTYNVHSCRGMDGKYAPRRIARVIAQEHPDVICLQELDRNLTRSGGVNQAEVIARQLRTEYRFHAASEPEEGSFGNAVFSVYPVRLVSAASLPSAPRLKELLSLPDRGALWVTLAVEGEEIHIINTHLSVLGWERRLQAEALMGPNWLAHPQCQGVVVLAGDFNAFPKSSTMRLLERRLRNSVEPRMRRQALSTWSGRMPLHRIDHVLVSEAIQVRQVYVPRTALTRVASDHLPFVAELVCSFSRGKDGKG